MEINTPLPWRPSIKGRGCQPLGESARALFLLLVSISASQRICIIAQDLGYAHNALRGVTLPEDVVRWEANNASPAEVARTKSNQQNPSVSNDSG
jgi:hypothetical protein